MTIMKTRLLSFAAVSALTLGAVHAAHAQSMDYGSLENLFNEPVTTSATGSPQRATDAPVDMSIITADDIKRSGAADLPTILSRVAGIDVLNWSAGGADVGVRGYDQALSPRLLVLINGRQVYLDDFGYTSWATLPVTLAEIRQIEVVRGPNSALFGFNAVGGVINIITFNPKYDNINSIEAHGGSQNDIGGSVVQTLHLGDRASIRLSASGERQDEWRNTAAYPTSWNAHAMADALFQLTPTTELRLEGSWARSATADMVSSATYNEATYTIRSIMATITSDTPYGEIQVQSYLNSLNNIQFSPAYSPLIGVAVLKNQVAVASVQDLFKIGMRNTVRIALEYRANQENTTPLDAGHLSYGLVAPSAMWNFAATGKLSLTGAVRLDHFVLKRTGPEASVLVYSRNSDWNRTIDSLAANLGAVYKLTEFDTFRATYARGIQIPTLVEYGGLQAVFAPGPFGLTLGGNPYLRPTVVSNYELSYNRIIPALNAKASVKAFFQQTDDVSGTWDLNHPLAPVPGIGAEAVFENASDSKMLGFELAASGKIDGGFRWSADTTYTYVTDKPIGESNIVNRQIAFSKTTPKFRGNAAVGWNDDRWAVDVYVHYVTAYDGYNPAFVLVPTPAYATLGARVGYQISNGLIVALSGQNLGARQQVQGVATGLQAPRRVIFSLTKSW